ncbi:MAG: CDP-alcohol phosphatidyltransferase family protein [Verrucomicrobiota bacterium]|nr:CDP-alcohol phosphatidyltransferase family protein [Verrucomicrobiota bacterium]
MAEIQSSIYSHIPHGITIVRLILAIVFPFLPEGWHLTVIAIALASEFLDGFIARLFGWTSYLGQIIDPVADKFFFFSVAIPWVWMGKLTLIQWILLGSRDLGMLFITMGVALVGRIRKVKSIKAQFLSKLTIVLQHAGLLAVMFAITEPLWGLCIATAITGTLAVIQYGFILRKRLSQTEES